MGKWKALGVALVAALVTACGIAPMELAELHFTTPPDYYPLWDANIACVNATFGANYTDKLDDDVKDWILVLRKNINVNGRDAAATFTTTDLGPAIKVAQPFVRREDVIRHEMLHALQGKHPELIGPNNDWHWSKLFGGCRVPVAVETRVHDDSTLTVMTQKNGDLIVVTPAQR